MTKFVCSKLFLAYLVLLMPVRVSEAQQDVKLVELWSERVVETVAQVASDPKIPKYELDYYVSLAALALGQNGQAEDALKLFDRIELSEDGGSRQAAMMMLADGLSTGDFVELALAESSKIENENLRASSFSHVQRSNPSWAENFYRGTRSVKLQAELAVKCLFAFAQKQ